MNVRTGKLENLMKSVSKKPNFIVGRWNQNQAGVFAVGGRDGRVIFYNLQNKKSTKILFKNKGKVEDLQWDPNSSNYLLVCWTGGEVSLIDAESKKEM